MRDIVLFGKDYVKNIYGSVLEACGLTTDVNSFANGDLTEISSKVQ